mmetsp:Transcript_50861/g.65125  ORF Transcript_50861/g.65125 Transcript_50861/m.65125 type:complete len:542 (-) Transcript_50861:131-1756(-)
MMTLLRATVLALALGLSNASCDMSADSCNDCTSDESICGWCEGNLYIDNVAQSGHCIDPTSTDPWSCDGVFKSAEECDCQTSGAPDSLVNFGPMRGLRMDSSKAINQEVNVQLFTGNSTIGSITWVDSTNGSREGTVASIQGCGRSTTCTGDQVFIDFDPSTPATDLQCTYRVDWQAGPDAHTVAMGCNTAGNAPDCFDSGEMLFVFWACIDVNSCPFNLNSIADDDDDGDDDGAKKEVSPFPLVLDKPSKINIEGEEDLCSGVTTCDECVSENGCGWCIGNLFDESDNSRSNGVNCFSTTSADNQCQGTTLTTDCTVYKCPWYEYYNQDPSTEGDCSDLTCSETTGDDPDFVRTDTPAMAYSTQDSCNNNCVDPTASCAEDDTCTRTYTCNASATCAGCVDTNLPTHFKGIQMNTGYASGIWTLDMDDDYTTATWTSPSGDITTATISDWVYDGYQYTGDWVTTSPTGVDVVHSTKMYTSSGGALGVYSYLAISPNSNEMNWNQGIMGAHNGTEYALLTCLTDYNGTTISGLYDVIDCAI